MVMTKSRLQRVTRDMKKTIGAVAVAAVVMAQTGIATSWGASNCAMTMNKSANVVLEKVSGDVLVAGKSGYMPARAGTVLAKGAQVIFGSTGSGLLKVSGKVLSVKPNTTVSLTADAKAGDRVCISMRDTVKVHPAADMDAPAAGMSSSQIIPLALAGAAAVGIGVAIATSSSHSASH